MISGKRNAINGNCTAQGPETGGQKALLAALGRGSGASLGDVAEGAALEDVGLRKVLGCWFTSGS